ncbi:putative lipoprotein [Myxococcus xanthus DK 1622]|uniref:Lipoprotein n=1 Tax=Myxococcus xanthus (strain DK1622) TaxID=246197 RepID=Q1DE45_MYXXD|nr:putative lipoprotein [Myxococcus xanthus DK 1622]
MTGRRPDSSTWMGRRVEMGTVAPPASASFTTACNGTCTPSRDWSGSTSTVTPPGSSPSTPLATPPATATSPTTSGALSKSTRSTCRKSSDAVRSFTSLLAEAPATRSEGSAPAPQGRMSNRSRAGRRTSPHAEWVTAGRVPAERIH